MGNQKSLEKIIEELSPESQEQLRKHLNSLKKIAVQGAATQVMMRNQSHNLGENAKQQAVKKPTTKK